MSDSFTEGIPELYSCVQQNQILNVCCDLTITTIAKKKKREKWGQKDFLRVEKTKQNKSETVTSLGATCRVFISLGVAFSCQGALWGKWPL